METIFAFLTDIARNNQREWFYEHRHRYDEAYGTFVRVVEDMIARIGHFDVEVMGLPVKSTLYRFHRDTRFSPDKSPYKRHFGAYINPRGKKSPHGGYYLHIEPGQCCVAGGAYCLESRMLKAVRTEIMERIDEYRAIVEHPEFRRLYPVIGMERLKTTPVGFPRDFSHAEYLRPKDFSVSCPMPDAFFLTPGWQEQVAEMFRTMKPFLDFVNGPIDDLLP